MKKKMEKLEEEMMLEKGSEKGEKNYNKTIRQHQPGALKFINHHCVCLTVGFCLRKLFHLYKFNIQSMDTNFWDRHTPTHQVHFLFGII